MLTDWQARARAVARVLSDGWAVWFSQGW